MATDHKTAVSLYRDTMKQISKNAYEWMKFLDSACRNYKLAFDELVLVYAQRPDARALMSYEQWTGSYKRWIQRGSVGIAVFDKQRNGKYVKYYFDIADTRRGKFSKTIPLWEMQPIYETDVIETLENSVGDLEDKDNLASAILSASEIAVEDHMLSYLEDLQSSRTGSLIEDLDELNVGVLFRRLLSNSIAYMMMKRCGIDPASYIDTSDFAGLAEFNTSATINILGSATREITEPMLRAIGSTVLTLEKDRKKQNHTFDSPLEPVHNDNRKRNLERSHDHEHRTDTERGLPVSESDSRNTGRTGSDGLLRPDDGESLENKSQGHIHGTADNGGAEQLSSTISERGPATGRRTGEPLGEERRDKREIESQRSPAVGRSDEQLSDGSRANGTTLQQLALPTYPTETEQLSFFQAGYSESKSNPAFSVSQQTIDEVLCHGSNRSNSRLRICLNYMKGRSHKENVAFLRDEFRGGANGFILDGKRITVSYADDGIHIGEGNSAMNSGYVLSFEDSDSRIQELLSLGQYMPQNEIDRAEEFEYRYAAQSFLYFYRDIEQEYRFLDENPEPLGFPDAVEKLTEKLHDPEELQKLTAQLSDFTQQYHKNPDMMRWRNSRPDKILLLLQDLAIPNKLFTSEIEQIRDITRFISQDEIDSHLKSGSHVEQSKFRIYEFFRQEHTPKEKTEFIKREYGTSCGTTAAFPATDNGYADYSSKALVLSRGTIGAPYAKVSLTWNQVAKRITELIDTDQYLSAEEKSNLPLYHAQLEEERQKHERFELVHQAVDLLPENKQETLYTRIFYFILDLDNYERGLFPDEATEFLSADESGLKKLLQNPDQITALGSALFDIGKKTCDCHIRNHARAFISELDYLFTERNGGKEYELGFGHMGNGLTVWNRKEEKDGDYKTVAQIAPDRTISYFEDLPRHVRDEIEQTAATSEMAISTTQDIPVFKIPPILSPVQLYRKYLDKLVVDIQKEEINDFLRDRDTDPVDAENTVADRVVFLSDVYGEEDTAYREAYDQLPMFREWLIEDVFDRTYNDVPQLGDEISRHLSDPHMPDWMREEAARITELAEQTQPDTANGSQVQGESLESPTALTPIVQLNEQLQFENKLPETPQSADTSENEPLKLREVVIDLWPHSEIPEQTNEEKLAIPDRLPVKSKKRSIGGHRIPLQKTYHESKNYDSFPGVADENRKNFVIWDENLGHGGQKSKYQMNIAAIKTLKQIESENRLATPEEQEILHRYVGWGGIPQAFDERKADWNTEYQELKDLLNETEYPSALASTLNAHYTSPVVIQTIYQGLRNLDFKSGNILDPGCGVGNFQGLLPADMQDSKVYGVELDSITGRIAQQLYPKNSILIQGFESTELPDSFFDLAVGNIPFGGFKLSDKRYNKHNFLIHDYFFAKTLDKIRPGGIIAFVTSKGTLDKKSPEVRKYIAQRAELLGAIRLPNNAFKANAGTEVTTDIIFLQKRDRQIDIEPSWIHLDQTADGIPVNSYFTEHPEMLLGKMVFDRSMYGNETETACEPFENSNLKEQLATAIQNIQGKMPEYERNEEEPDYSIPADPNVRNYSFTLKDGDIYFRENSRMFPVELSKTAQARVEGLIQLRDCLRELITMQLENGLDSDMQAVRQDLNTLYDVYVEKYGRIYERGNSMAFSEDSSYYLLCSLEVLGDENQFERKADIFTKHTINPITAITHCETASEALAVSISERGKVDLPFMQALTDLPEEQIISDLCGVIYRDLGRYEPGVTFDLNSRPFVTEDEYLSGNVREKLQDAKRLVEIRPDLQNEIAPYVNALERVQPEDLKASEISVILGSAWVPPEIFEHFMYEIFETSPQDREKIKLAYNPAVGEWRITNKVLGNSNVTTSKTFGTKRINAYHILERVLNLREIKIMDTQYVDGKETKVLNKNQTLSAQAKRDKIKDAFQEWIWEDPARRHRLTAIYNEKFNNIRPRQYNGQHLKFHGMNPDIVPRENQVNAIARGLYGGNELLGHCVGAGKTIIMSAIAMEKKHLGLCSKTLVVVPNHITEQFAAEWLRLYPAANLLVTTKKDFEMKNRKKLSARIATGNYDAVIIGHSQLLKIPVSRERQERLIRQQVYETAYGIELAKEEDGENFTIKQLEGLKKSLEEKLKKLLDSEQDDVVTFEELGIDGLMIDEVHEFKNLFFATKMRNVGGIAQTDAKKSSDLFMKCQYLDELTDSKGITFATGTPISNSMVEMYTMQRYLQYQLLESTGLHHFDEWATTFGQTVTAMELAPEGFGYRMKTRFAKFHNLGQLVMMFRECADIVTEDMLDIPVPDVQYITEDLEPSEFQKEIVLSFAKRAEAVRDHVVEPHVDNMLKITNEGRKLALDQRLINPLLPDNPDGKVNKCVENVYRIWDDTAEKRSAQLVFCDLSTPTKATINMVEQEDGSYAMDGFQDVYHDLKYKLILKGIPEEEIAFIHDAKTELQKKMLFAKVRSGTVRILIGSTAKMGAGTNCQNKLVALHDLDPPWRPSDLAQRLGRIKRFGNENELVYVFRYVTKGTFDAYMFQLIENKQRFISQIFTSKSVPQIADDIDETALSYAEIKALATGDPRVLERCNLEAELQKLRVLHAAFLSQKHDYEDMVQALPKSIQETVANAAKIKQDMEIVAQQPPKPETGYPITLQGVVYAERKEGGKALINACKALEGTEKIDIGSYRGFSMQLYFHAASGAYYIDLIGSHTHPVWLGEDIHGNLQRIDNRISDLPKKYAEMCQYKETCENNLAKAKTEVQNESPYRAEISEKTKRFEELNEVLQAENTKDFGSQPDVSLKKKNSIRIHER